MDITAQRAVPPEKVEIQTLQTRKSHVALGGSEGSRASSRTHFTAENVQTTSDVEILKVKEPINSFCAKGALNPKVHYALVKAALQTVSEELADGGFLLGSYSTWGILQSVWKNSGGAEITWKYPKKGRVWVLQKGPEGATENMTYFWW